MKSNMKKVQGTIKRAKKSLTALEKSLPETNLKGAIEKLQENHRKGEPMFNNVEIVKRKPCCSTKKKIIIAASAGTAAVAGIITAKAIISKKRAAELADEVELEPQTDFKCESDPAQGVSKQLGDISDEINHKG